MHIYIYIYIIYVYTYIYIYTNTYATRYTPQLATASICTGYIYILSRRGLDLKLKSSACHIYICYIDLHTYASRERDGRSYLMIICHIVADNLSLSMYIYICIYVYTCVYTHIYICIQSISAGAPPASLGRPAPGPTIPLPRQGT